MILWKKENYSQFIKSLDNSINNENDRLDTTAKHESSVHLLFDKTIMYAIRINNLFLFKYT